MAYRSPQREEPTLEQALNSLGRTSYRLEQLEAENAALRAQLGASTQSFHPERTTSTSSDLDTVPTQLVERQTSAQISSEQWNDLVRAHAALQANFASLESQHRDITQKYRIAKERIRQWKDYLAQSKHVPSRGAGRHVLAADARLSANEGRLENAHGDSDRTPRGHVTHASTSTIQATVANRDSTCESPEVPSSPPARTSVPEQLASHAAVQSPSIRRSTVTSSQTTVDDGVDEGDQEVSTLPVKAEPSSDGPVFVSARCLKRKISPGDIITPDQRQIKRERNTVDDSVEVLSHEVDISQRTPQREMHPETSDLDALGAPIITPRRPKIATAHAYQQRATSEELGRQVPMLRRNRSSLSDGDVEQQADHNHAGASIASSRQPNQSTGQPDELRSTASESRVLQHPFGDILKPISGNVSRKPSLNHAVVGSSKQSRPRRTDCENKILLLSEDGDNGDDHHSACLEKQDKHKAATPQVRQRLDDLLNKPSPIKTTPFQLPPLQDRLIRPRPPPPAHLITPVSTVKKSSPVKKASPAKRPSPAKRALPRERVSPAKQVSNLDQRARTPVGSPPPVRPEDEPLRIRPMETLGLSDFRINPGYMGTTFAFADPVRGKEQRKSLPVCNQQGCSCSSLRTAIRMGGTALSGKTDAGALEAYFGTEWRNLVGGYNMDDRKEILIQAHAHCFANQHGKHRQAFERRSTPPGYWRTDFPTTQEQKDDHAIADERERKAVEERYREAMRTGGRWKFRDE